MVTPQTVLRVVTKPIWYYGNIMVTVLRFVTNTIWYYSNIIWYYGNNTDSIESRNQANMVLW